MPDTDKKTHGWQKNRKPHSGFLPRLCLLVTEQRMTSCGVFKGSLGMVAFGLAVVLWLAMSAASPSLASDDKEVWFHIPKQRADIALTTFAKQAGVSVLFPFDSVSSQTANKLIGRYSVETALRILLEDTGFEAAVGDGGQVTVHATAMGKKGKDMGKSKGFALYSAILPPMTAFHQSACKTAGSTLQPDNS